MPSASPLDLEKDGQTADRRASARAGAAPYISALIAGSRLLGVSHEENADVRSAEALARAATLAALLEATPETASINTATEPGDGTLPVRDSALEILTAQALLRAHRAAGRAGQHARAQAILDRLVRLRRNDQPQVDGLCALAYDDAHDAAIAAQDWVRAEELRSETERLSITSGAKSAAASALARMRVMALEAAAQNGLALLEDELWRAVEASRADPAGAPVIARFRRKLAALSSGAREGRE